MSYDAVRTVGELYWSSHEQTLSVTPGLFLSALTAICNSIKSQSGIFYFLFISGQNYIKILLVSCSERCWRWWCTQRMFVCGRVYICATAVMKNNKTDGISFFALLCSLAHSPLFSECLSCSCSVFEFRMRFLFLSYMEIGLYIPFEAFEWMIS